MNTLKHYFPIPTVSEANVREHWATKHKRKKEQQLELSIRLPKLPECFTPDRITITLTRFYTRRPMDSDNLAGCFKHVRDGIAKWLKVDDGDDKLTWKYEQVKGLVGGFEMKLEPTV